VVYFPSSSLIWFDLVEAVARSGVLMNLGCDVLICCSVAVVAGDAGFVPPLCDFGDACMGRGEGRCRYYHSDEIQE
jgi:hypothetical protein